MHSAVQWYGPRSPQRRQSRRTQTERRTGEGAGAITDRMSDHPRAMPRVGFLGELPVRV